MSRQRQKDKQPGFTTRLLQTFTVLSALITWSILYYPVISDVWNRHIQSTLITAYEADTAEEIDYSEELQASRAYNEALYRKHAPEADAYSARLNLLQDQMMGYIEIPAIDVAIPIYHDTTDEVLSKGIGHLQEASLPIGGANTHAVLVGHSGLSRARIFSDLEKMKPGDRFYITTLGSTLAYQVDQIKTVLPEETEELSIIDGADLCTLVTCTPYGINTHRLLVRGQRVEMDEIPVSMANENVGVEKAELKQVKMVVVFSLCALMYLVGGAMIVKIWWRYKK